MQITFEELSDKILSGEPNTEQTISGKTLAIYDTKDIPGVYLGHKVFDHHPVDYCLIRILERKWQIASNPTSDLTLRAIVGKHTIGGVKIVAAGRPDKLLAIEATASKIPAEFHGKVVKWIKHTL
jgi:hypothetical protein